MKIFKAKEFPYFSFYGSFEIKTQQGILAKKGIEKRSLFRFPFLFIFFAFHEAERDKKVFYNKVRAAFFELACVR